MRAATEGNLPPVMPQGNLDEVLRCEVRQGSPGELMVESSPSRHVKQTRRCQMRLRTRPPLLTYLLTAPPAGSVPALCPSWKRGHCTGEDWCPKRRPRPVPVQQSHARLKCRARALR